jgi:ribosome-associated toxin RatA of RatAB toxin-antitoxin module
MRNGVAGLMLVSAGLAAAVPPPHLDVSVDARDGLYHVSATFSVPQPASAAFAVLTDYEQIPRFMPDVRKSQVLERREGGIVVEQEAVAHVMMFSKRVHLVLEIEEAPHVIRFHDRCGKSFERYEGAWTISGSEAHVQIAYTLTAKPTFDVPEFLLKRLLRRDAQTMIERLRGEIARRAKAAGAA